MPAIWPQRGQDDLKGPRDVARRLGIVGASTVLSGAIAAFAVSLVPPVHRARIELSADGAPLPSWTNAEIHDLIRRETHADETEADEVVSLNDLLNRSSGPLEGSVSRRAGVTSLSSSRSVVWADAGSAALAEKRVRLIVADLLARVPSPAKRLAAADGRAGSPQSANDAAPDPARRSDQDPVLKDLEARMADAERRLADFDAVISASPAPAAAEGQEIAARALLEQRQADLDAAIVAVEKGEEGDAPSNLWQGWDTWRRLVAETRTLKPKADELAAQFDESHPRVQMVRLRLRQLTADIEQQRETLLADLRAERAANGAALRALTPSASASADPDSRMQARDTLRADLTAARADLAAWRAKRRSEEAASPDAQATAAKPLIAQTQLPPTQRSLSLWPGALAGSVAGFLGSSFFLALSRSLRRKEEIEAGPILPAVSLTSEAPSRPEVAMIDDVIEALRASELSRAIVVAAGAGDGRPLSVDLARRLALRGRSVLLVDLSKTQDAARAMGLAPSEPGLIDLVRGDANFSEIARRDFATGADIVAAGRSLQGEDDTGRWSERRHALDFMERSYETLLIDAGRVDTTRLKTMIDAEAALLVSVEGCSSSETDAAVGTLAESGFADMILVRDRQSA
ncbi:hypothetical protein [Aureimonas sp. D3]|uniref:hypothetical protein n=1 Tax=Aureimonas sp. D3 TaxID=1638164 RepID=UPI0007842620|nr:hypothetical protein [Aureimonas sp. D3]